MKVSETQGNEDSICAVLGLSPFFEEALSWVGAGNLCHRVGLRCDMGLQ